MFGENNITFNQTIVPNQSITIIYCWLIGLGIGIMIGLIVTKAITNAIKTDINWATISATNKIFIAMFIGNIIGILISYFFGSLIVKLACITGTILLGTLIMTVFNCITQRFIKRHSLNDNYLIYKHADKKGHCRLLIFGIWSAAVCGGIVCSVFGLIFIILK